MRRAFESLPEEVVQLLSPFFPGFDLSRVRIYEGIPRYVVANPIGYTDRCNIYFAPGAYRVDTSGGLALIAHEIAHCQQYQRHGTWGFRARYLTAYFKNRMRGMDHLKAYRNIPFEIEAREIEAEVHRALKKLSWERTHPCVPDDGGSPSR
ncbi:MAG: DUF4157 domain-containing protein [Blastocatellales bacterium]